MYIYNFLRVMYSTVVKYNHTLRIYTIKWLQVAENMGLYEVIKVVSVCASHSNADIKKAVNWHNSQPRQMLPSYQEGLVLKWLPS